MLVGDQDAEETVELEVVLSQVPEDSVPRINEDALPFAGKQNLRAYRGLGEQNVGLNQRLECRFSYGL